MRLNVFANKELCSLKAKKNWTLILIAISFIASLILYFSFGVDKKSVGIGFFTAFSFLAIAENHYMTEIKNHKKTQFV